MKRLVLVMLCLVWTTIACGASCGAAQEESFFPDNELWKYDDVKEVSLIDEGLFNQIISAGQDSYQRAEAIQRNEKIIVNRKWSDKTVNANVARTKKCDGEVIINMYGGLARRKEITPAGFTLVFCHELGHAYGGLPYVYPQTELSAEGQSDFYSARRCYLRVWERVPELQKFSDEYESFIENNCTPKDSLCRNALEGGHGLANLLSFMMGEDDLPMFETPDPYITPSTLLSYPKTAQCRLDTISAGIFVNPRPACWFRG